MDVTITTKCEKCSEEIALLFQMPASEMYLPTVEQLKDLLERKDWSIGKMCLCPVCEEDEY